MGDGGGRTSTRIGLLLHRISGDSAEIRAGLCRATVRTIWTVDSGSLSARRRKQNKNQLIFHAAEGRAITNVSVGTAQRGKTRSVRLTSFPGVNRRRLTVGRHAGTSLSVRTIFTLNLFLLFFFFEPFCTDFTVTECVPNGIFVFMFHVCMLVFARIYTFQRISPDTQKSAPCFGTKEWVSFIENYAGFLFERQV